MSSPILTTGLLNGTGANPADKNDPKKIASSAKQFEALMIAQVLKTMHEEDGQGWLGTGEDQTASSAMGMADEYFAQALSSRGGLGLAQMISKSLEKRHADQSRPDPAGPAAL